MVVYVAIDFCLCGEEVIGVLPSFRVVCCDQLFSGNARVEWSDCLRKSELL